MNIATTRVKLLRNKSGKFRRLKVGEPVEENDIHVGDHWYSELSHNSRGSVVQKGETIIRLEFDK